MSSTPWTRPASTSFSIARPPVPVAWKTRQSKPRASSSSRTAVTQGVVTPNIVMAIVGFSPAEGTGCWIMPAMAWAALPSTRRETALRPATSTTGYIIRMSLVPTYGATLPLAIVETMTLGSPIGRARMAGVISAVLPLPPMPITPATRPASCSRQR